MNLLVAPDEVPTVVDIRRRRRDVLGRRIRAGDRLAQRQALVAVRVHEPYPYPIPVGRRRSVGPPWPTPVFDIDPEHHAPLGASAPGEGVVTRAREAYLVGGRAPRLGPADAVAGIAQRTHHPLHVRILRTGEAGAFQAVEVARVEVAEQPLPNVTHMRPLAGDARRVWRERCRDPDRCADLAPMRGGERRARTGIRRARAKRVGIAADVGARAAGVHGPATGHPTAGLRSRRLSRAEHQHERQDGAHNTSFWRASPPAEGKGSNPSLYAHTTPVWRRVQSQSPAVTVSSRPVTNLSTRSSISARSSAVAQPLASTLGMPPRSERWHPPGTRT